MLEAPKGDWVYGKCRKCKTERYFPADPEIKGRLRVAQRQKMMHPVTVPSKRTSAWYDEHREVISADVREFGVEATRKKWGMRGNTLERLMKRWATMGKPKVEVKVDGDRMVECADLLVAELVKHELITGRYVTVGLIVLEVLKRFEMGPE
jgi:hypothetical protein